MRRKFGKHLKMAQMLYFFRQNLMNCMCSGNAKYEEKRKKYCKSKRKLLRCTREGKIMSRICDGLMQVRSDLENMMFREMRPFWGESLALRPPPEERRVLKQYGIGCSDLIGVYYGRWVVLEGNMTFSELRDCLQNTLKKLPRNFIKNLNTAIDEGILD